MDDDLTRLEEWFGQILSGLSPRERRRAAQKLGQALRRSNIARIAANVQPDGSAMEPRKERRDRHGKVTIAAGAKMFTGLRFARRWRIDAAEDGVEIQPATNAAAYTAAINHFGQTKVIGRLRNGRTIRARYPERRLLGFSGEDERLVLDIVGEMFVMK